MNQAQFENMCVATIKREIDLFDLNCHFKVQLEELLSNVENSEKISATVRILFEKNECKFKHIIPVCWRSGWGIGYENDSGFQSITFTSLLQKMYLDIAIIVAD
ncbi:hypothetical protein MT390_10070 [Vibrio sp. 2-Bac 85]